MLESIGQKVKHGIEFACAVKGIYDVGKVVYSGFVAAAPYLLRRRRDGTLENFKT